MRAYASATFRSLTTVAGSFNLLLMQPNIVVADVDAADVTRIERAAAKGLNSLRIEALRLADEKRRLRAAIDQARSRFNKARDANPEMRDLHIRAAEYSLARVFGKGWE